ncbi:MAG TPA: Gfo/Idh/MocA family oxidoreductase [Solirubrobacteraceae bacterium]|nr:Gfo/Idh/MocA family oxidoreductase [Solirubrobacteraceae bacterium]
MTDAKLRLGVIGAGSWALASHLPNLAKRKDEVEFVAVCRQGEELLRKVADDYGFELASEDYRDVIAAGPDICVVSSPSGLHYEHAKAALEAGAHVLVEKPVTIDPAQAWELVEIASRNELHLLCSFGWNYLPMLRSARDLFARVGIGEIEQLNISMSSVTRELLANLGSYPDANPEFIPEQKTWTDPALSGGGYGQAQLSHALGLALWITGLRGAEVFAFMSTALGAAVELYDACAVRYTNGAIGTIAGGAAHAGYDDNKHQLEVRAIGSDGHFACDLQREMVWLYRPDAQDIKLDVAPGDALYDDDGPPNALVDLALGRPVENCSPGELGARTVELLDAAYRSARGGSPAAIAARAPQEAV